MLTRYDYDATKDELLELSKAIRLRAAREAKIDAERLSVEVLQCVAYEINGEPAYFRAERAEAKLDGEDIDRDNRRISWWLAQIMMAEHRVPNRARLRRVPV